MKKLAAVLFALCSLASITQARVRAYGFCEQGGQVVVLAGLSGTPDVQASFPSCTVNVFFAGLSGSVPISTISRSGNVVTVVFASSIANVTVNSTIVTAGVTDSTYNGTFSPLLSVNTSTNTVTYAQTGANSSSSGGSGKFTPSLFSDNLGTAQANPFTAQSTGLWFFYADNSRYDVQLSGGGFPSPFTFGDIPLVDPASLTTLGTLPNTVLAFSATPSFNVVANASYTMTLTGNVTSSTTTGAAVNGNLLSLTLNEDGTGGRTFVFPVNFILPSTCSFVTVANFINAYTFKFDGTNWNVISGCGPPQSVVNPLWANLLPGTNTSSGTFAQTSGTMDFSGSAAEKIPVAAGAAPSADGAVATNSTTHTFNFGSNGATVNVAAASTGSGGTGTTCAANQFVNAISTTAAPTCATPSATTSWASLTPGTNSNAGTFAASGNTWDFSAATLFKVPVAGGAAPTADGSIANNSTTHTLNFGSNGTTVNVAAASNGAGGTGTTCSSPNSITAISTTAAPTCSNALGSTFVIKAASTTSVCTTGSAAGATCTSTVNWPTAFADTSYDVVCGGVGTITGYPFVQGVAKTSTSQVTVTITNGTSNEAVASTWTELDCIGIHP